MPYWRAGIGGYQTDDGVKRGGLAGAIRSKQTNNFALSHPNTDPIYNPATTIGFADFVGGQGTHLTCHLRLSDCRGCVVAFDQNPTIVSKYSQRNPSNLAMFGIKNARRSAGQHE